jgi:hypothetical protein
MAGDRGPFLGTASFRPTRRTPQALSSRAEARSILPSNFIKDAKWEGINHQIQLASQR